jgi:2-dehydro-3-deoxygluconokinase
MITVTMVTTTIRATGPSTGSNRDGGGGEGFAAGFFYGLLAGEPEEEALKLRWAHGALLTTFPGDTTMATLDQVRAFAKGASARIQR